MVLVLVIVGVVAGVKRKRASGTWHPNDKRNSRADGERDTPSPLRRRSTWEILSDKKKPFHSSKYFYNIKYLYIYNMCVCVRAHARVSGCE